ncbi:MAG: J domain-containing protein [Candidatus Sulfotelmatobacter sp.]
MSIDEALDVLALRPAATPSEIKEAYRDLVKVWHPDRFGSDLRLRQKAELQLKRINEAYRVLQSDRGVSGMYTPGVQSEPTSSARYPSSPRADGRRGSASPIWPSGRYRWTRRLPPLSWISTALGIVAILLVGYLFIEDGPMPSAASSPAAAAQGNGQAARPADVTSTNARPRSVGHSKTPDPGGFRVRSLSEAETDRLETLCSPQKQLHGQAAYQFCLKAQLDWMTNPAGKPDLSSLGEAERTSIESVCSQPGRLQGQDHYNRCETEQVASLAAEPARPDVSTLNDADRRSIDSACANAKNHEGPAAYNRCLERFMKALAQSK